MIIWLNGTFGAAKTATYQAAHGWLIKDADLIVDTSAMRPVQVAERIAAALPAIRVHEA